MWCVVDLLGGHSVKDNGVPLSSSPQVPMTLQFTVGFHVHAPCWDFVWLELCQMAIPAVSACVQLSCCTWKHCPSSSTTMALAAFLPPLLQDPGAQAVGWGKSSNFVFCSTEDLGGRQHAPMGRVREVGRKLSCTVQQNIDTGGLCAVSLILLEPQRR